MNKRKKGFLGLLRRYMDGTSTKEEKEVMDVWYHSLDREQEIEKHPDSRQKLEEKIWKQIQTKKQGTEPEPVVIARKWWDIPLLKLASAASLVFVLGFLYFFSENRRSKDLFANISSEEFASLSKSSNTGPASQRIKLADGSHITLQPGATLYYPEKFNSEKRVVYLQGDAYFDITKNPSKPFLVYTGDIVTKVLGTSFTIQKSSESGNIEVAVITGKVLVEKAKNNSSDFTSNTGGVMLTPNKKVTFLHDTEKYVAGIVEKPVLVYKTPEFQNPEAFIFEEAPLSKVIEKLEKAYGVEIEIENRSILNCPITADLSDESMFAKLEIINALLNTKSDVKETSVVLSGGACTPFKPSVNQP